MGAPWVIVGCGYTGTYLARALVDRGDSVTLTRRSRAAAEELARSLGVRGAALDLSGASTDATALGPTAALAGLLPAGAIVACLAPPGPEPEAELRALLGAIGGAARLVYVSSTGVYGRGGGAWVDESWPIDPITAAGRARARAEAVLAESPVPWVALRAAGIHGPRRKLADRIRAGTYQVVGDGASHVSRIHVVDLVAAILAAAERPVRGFVNVADDDPAPVGEVVDTIAARMGLPPPPRVAAASVSSELAGMLTADRRIANRRLKDELGVVLRFPSWRDLI
jgi:nucleoside-diphosphate-sugar epimerase